MYQNQRSKRVDVQHCAKGCLDTAQRNLLYSGFDSAKKALAKIAKVLSVRIAN